MKIGTRTVSLALAATAIVSVAAGLPAQAATRTMQQTPHAVGAANPARNVHDSSYIDGWVTSEVDVQNLTGEPLDFRYDSDGAGHGYDMYFVNSDGTPVNPYVLRHVAAWSTARIYVKSAVLFQPTESHRLNGDAEADVYPIGVSSGRHYNILRIQGHDDGARVAYYSWLSANFTQGSAHSFSESNSHVGASDLRDGMGGSSDALGITKNPVSILRVADAK